MRKACQIIPLTMLQDLNVVDVCKNNVKDLEVNRLAIILNPVIKQGGLRRECGLAEGCTCDVWSPPPAPATLTPSPHPLRALDETLPSVLRSNPLYSEEEEQEIVIIVESLGDHGGEVDAVPPRPPRRAPSTSSGYGSGGGSNGRSSPHLPKIVSGPALLPEKNDGSHGSDSDGSPDCTLSRSLRDDIRSCLGGHKWERDVDHVLEAAVKGAGGLTAAKARLHAALLALQTQPIPARASIPSLPYCGPGVRPGDVTMMPKNSEISLLAASALFTLDGATSEALSRRLARHERRRRKCRAALSIAMVLLLVAAVGAIELFLSRGRRLFGNVLR